MKKQPKKAKPVEAWAVIQEGDILALEFHEDDALAEADDENLTDENVVRLVPATSEAEVRRLKRIERAAREWYQDMRGWSLAPESKRLFDALSTSLRFKRTKP